MPSKELYQLADEFRKTKLWEKVYDSELFAVRLADGRTGYVCVMGNAGNHFALAVYPGREGMESCRRLSESDDCDKAYSRRFEIMMGQDCLMCSFVDREDMSPAELTELQAYGLRFRGKSPFPSFQRFVPRCYPWRIETEAEEECLRLCLRAGIEAAKKLTPAKGENIHELKRKMGFAPGMSMGLVIPLLTPCDDGTFAWERIALPEPLKTEHPSPRVTNELVMAKLKKQKKQNFAWECGMILMREAVTNEAKDGIKLMDELTEAPRFPMALLLVNHETCFLDSIETSISLDNYSEELLDAFVDKLQTMAVPKALYVHDERTYQLLLNTAKQLSIPLHMEEKLTFLEEAEESLWEFDREDDAEDAEFMILAMLDNMGSPAEMPKEMRYQLQRLADAEELTAPTRERIRLFLAGESATSGEDSASQKPKKRGKQKAKAESYVISVSQGKGCYRHIQISSSATLEELHTAILIAFDFMDDHAHAFFLDNHLWSEDDCYYASFLEDEDCFTDEFKLSEVGLTIGQPFKYVFDFGEEWVFQCKLLRIVPEATRTPLFIRMVGEPIPQYDEE